MSASPPSLPSFHFGDMNGFLPLNEETAVSTRGQRLPGLLRNRSSQSLQSNVAPTTRRLSMTRSHDEEDGNAAGMIGYRLPGGDVADRKMSMGAEILMTPQMRSQRLIGNSNPRYRW